MNEKQLRAELDAVYGSISWRITAPLRHLSAFVKRFILRPLSPKVWLRLLISFVLRRPTLVTYIKRILSSTPSMKRWAQSLTYRATQVEQQAYVPPNLELPQENQLPMMSTSSAMLYRELQCAIKERV